MRERNCSPAPVQPCNPPQAGSPINNNISRTVNIYQGAVEFYSFDVQSNGWTGATIASLIGKKIVGGSGEEGVIMVDGVGRKCVEILETDNSMPPDGTFYWKKTTAELIYRPSLNINAWVSFQYVS